MKKVKLIVRNQKYLSVPQMEADPCISLTSRRRELALSINIRNINAYKIFQRAWLKLKCVLFWSNIIKDIRIYGTGSSIFDGSKNFKENLLKIMFSKLTDKTKKKLKLTKVERKYLILPYSLFFKVWSLILGFALLYTCLIMPWILAFEEASTEKTWFVFDTLINVIYCIDILITSNLAYKDEKGKLVTIRANILKNYITGMLLFDILAVIPFNMIMNTDQKINNFVKLLRIARLIRIIKILKVKKIFESLSGGSQSTMNALNKLVVGLLMILLLIHFTSCLWNFLPKLENSGPNTWIYKYNYLDKTTAEKYLTGVYFAVTTILTVGFGDISAGSKTEMILCITLELLGIIFYSFILGVMTSLLTSIDHKEVLLKSRIHLVHMLSNDIKLPDEIFKKMRRETKKYFERLMIDDEKRIELCSRIPKKIRYRMCMSMYGGAIQKIHFFKKQEKSFISDYVPRLVYLFLKEREIIFSKGDYPDEIYFLMSGRVSFIFGKQNMVFKTMIEGSYFGEIGLIDKTLREFGAMTLVNSELLLMSSQIFNEMIEKYPLVYAGIKDTAEKRKICNRQNRQEIVDLLEIYEIKKTHTIEEIAGIKPENRFEDMKNQEIETTTNRLIKDDLELRKSMYVNELKLIRKRLKKFHEKFNRACLAFSENVILLAK
ncbi:hypothetical protein SteCoe_19582 [Stentor coeruleus]|uniref:Cyclic nucleotide-binding domain-containing protein n=1 Tax=Stentor coeruleus TaxID=5963 RepID=A0A1R2BTS1_9CILI|nr:hypothetical protein SteCoe_19582 [Stentor coeruleus]